MFAHQAQIAGQRPIGERSLVINPRLKCVVGAQQAKGRRSGKQLSIGSRRQTGVGIVFVIRDRADVILDQGAPRVAGQRREKGIDLIGSGLGVGY